MATNVVLPQWGMGMREGTVVAWLKAEGDAVAEDEPIVEVEAEKTTEEVCAPTSGILARILVPAGQSARIYDVLAVLTAPGEALPDAAPTTLSDPPTAPDAHISAQPARTIERPGGNRQVEPRARRLAQERGIDVDTLVGSGPDGRITEADVLRALDTP